MKRSLLIAALALTCASTTWAAGPSDQGVIIAQQQQQTALLQSINAKLDVQGQAMLAQNVMTAAADQRATVPGNLPVNGIGGVMAAKVDHDAAITASLPDPRTTSVAQLTIKIYSVENGKEKLSQTMTMLASSASPTHAFTGTNVPYRAAATDQIGKDGKPVPPTMKTLNVGTFVNITPLDIEKDHAVLSLGINQSRLISLATFEANGLAIDLPSTKNLDQTQGLNLKVGQNVEFQGLDGRIVVSLNRIEAPSTTASSQVLSSR